MNETYLLAGHIAHATTLARQTLDLAHQQADRGSLAWTLCLLGDIAMHRDPPEFEQAEAHYQQALALANELGMRPLQQFALDDATLEDLKEELLFSSPSGR